jgi:phosphatidylinositol-3,4,5-trisphosphate 3-phosphatase/dual-specificity protein phosphatase PTEN
MVFALPGEPGLTELAGDFKIHFHDRQGDFYCWLNTTMMENRKIINTSELDGFDKRKLPSPGFQVEVVLADLNAPPTSTRLPDAETASQNTDEAVNTDANTPNQNKESIRSNDEDNVFSDGEGEDSKSRQVQKVETVSTTSTTPGITQSNPNVASLTQAAQQVKISDTKTRGSITEMKSDSGGAAIESSNVESEFKAMAADASVFSFGDDEDYESE